MSDLYDGSSLFDDDDNEEEILTKGEVDPTQYQDQNPVINNEPPQEQTEQQPVVEEAPVGEERLQTSTRNPLTALNNALEQSSGFNEEEGRWNTDSKEWNEQTASALWNWIDDTFQGDQKTKESIYNERVKKFQKFEETYNKNQQLNRKATGDFLRKTPGLNILTEAVSTRIGAGLGSTENLLEFAEWTGDFWKTAYSNLNKAAGLNLYRVSEDNDISSDKYRWAQWDLGKSKLGAQTGFGKLVQSFWEFYLTGRRLGGHRSSRSTSRLQKFLYGGAVGITTDLVQSLMDAERSNLSNALEEWQPWTKDTFLTALAIDEDDDAYTAALKTTIEGFPIGGLAENFDAAIPIFKEAYKMIRSWGGKPGTPQQIKELTNGIGDLIPIEIINRDTFNSEIVPTLNQKLLDADSGITELRSVRVEAESLRNLDVDEQVDWFANQQAEGINGVTLGQLRKFLGIQAQLKTAGSENYASRVVELPNNARVTFTFQDFGAYQHFPIVKTLRNLGKEVNTVAWEMEDLVSESDVLGNYGKRLFGEFQKIAKTELEPGTLLANNPVPDSATESVAKATKIRNAQKKSLKPVNEKAKEIYVAEKLEEWKQYSAQKPIDDETLAHTRELFMRNWDGLDLESRLDHAREYSAEGKIDGFKYEGPNQRAKLYQRAGFGKLDNHGTQYSIVRSKPNGKGQYLEPLDFNEDLLNSLDEAGKEAYIKEITDKVIGQINPILEAKKLVPPNSPRGKIFRVWYENIRQGIPVHYDDIKATFPEYFVAGTKSIPTEFHPNVITEIDKVINKESFGFSVNPFTGETPTTGYSVAIDGATIKAGDDYNQFIAKHADILSRDDALIGGYIMEKGPLKGETVIEISRHVDDQIEAELLGRAFDQESVWKFGVDPDKATIPTYGKDLLKNTKGAHLKSPESVPRPEPKTVDSTTAAKQILQNDQNPIRGSRSGTQRVLTNAQIRLLSDGTDEGVADLLRSLNIRNPINLDDLKATAKLTDKQMLEQGLEKAQEAMDMTGKVDLKKIEYDPNNLDELSDIGILQVRFLLQNVSQQLYDNAYHIMQKGNVNVDNFEDVKQLAESWKALAKIHKINANAAGRRLHTYSLKLGETGIEVPNPIQPPSMEQLAREIRDGEKVLDDLIEKMGKGDPTAKREAMRIAQALLLADGDPSLSRGLFKYVREISLGQAFKSFYNSLLSGPATHAVNAISNAANIALRPVTGIAGSYLGGNKSHRQMAIAGFYGFQHTLKDSWEIFGRVFKNGGTPINDGGKVPQLSRELNAKVELIQKVAAESDDVGLKAASGIISMQKALNEFPLMNLPMNLLTSSDEFFKTMVSRMEYNSRIMSEAISEAGTDVDKVDEIFKTLLEKHKGNNFDLKSGAITNPDILKVAKDMTFQTELDGWMKMFGNFVNNSPLLKPFFPFVKTGHNIMVYTASHVPVLNRGLVEYRAVMEGTDEYAKSVWRGREALGSMTILSTATAAATGHITGNAPPDPERRKIWLKTHQERSIKIGEYIDADGNKQTRWLRYDRIEPFGQIMAATADLVEMWKGKDLSEDQVQYWAGHLQWSLAANFTNKSYMQGLVPLGKLLTPNYQGLDKMATIGPETLNSFLPYSSARRAFSNALNPYMQEFNGSLERLRFQATGGLVGGGNISYDWLTGEPIQNDSGGGNAFSPLKVNTRNTSIVHDKLEDIQFDTSVIIQELGGIELKPEHKSRLLQLMGESGLHDQIKKWVTLPDFDEAVEAYKDKLRTGQNVSRKNEIFYKEISRMVRNARDEALEQVKAEFPELNQEIRNQNLLRHQQKTGPLSQSQQVQNLANF